MKIILIAVSLISFSFPQAYAKPDGPIVLSGEKLTALRESKEMQALKNVLSKKSSCIDCADVFESANSAKAFIVVEKESNGFGGNFVLVVFAKIPKLYRLWIYPTEKKQKRI